MYNYFMQFADHIGILGVILTLIAYYLLNVGKLHSESLVYLLLNLIGSVFLLVSLIFHWNLSSVCIEVAWISISLIGIYRAIRARNNAVIDEMPNNLYVLHPAQKNN